MPLDGTTLAAVGLYLLIILLPGAALLVLLRPAVADGGVWLGLAAGLGLALQPLIYLWAGLAGLSLGPATWYLVLGTSAGLVLWAARKRAATWRGRRPQAAHWILLGILVLLLAARWWAAHALTVPQWGDSFQHSLMVRLFLERGGLPDDWRPFAELSTFTYHFGLHGGVATLAWLTGLPPHRALLVAGQVLMVVQALTLYALASGLTGRPWAGVGAAVATCLGPMPAYYLNWGRYTQLAGQVVLPAAALAAFAVPWPQQGWRRSWPPIALAGVAVAGLALTHYLVTVFFALLALAWVFLGPRPDVSLGSVVVRGDPAPGGSRSEESRVEGALARFLGLIPVAGVALVLALPWAPRFVAGVLDDMAIRLATSRVGDPEVFGIVDPRALWGTRAAIDHHLGLVLLTCAVLAAAYGLWRRERLVLLGLSWGLLMVLAAYPGLVGLPVSGLVKDFTVVIALYLPLGLVLGGACSLAMTRPSFSRPALALASAAAVGVVFMVVDQAQVVDEGFALVAPADEVAMDWIAGHTPADATFYVGSFDAFGGTVQAGDDAGWWLPVLAGRRTTVPPITTGTERSFDPDYREGLNRLAAACREDIDGRACRAGLDAAAVGYAYGGVTGHNLPRDRLAASPNWRTLYDKDGATVFERRR